MNRFLSESKAAAVLKKTACFVLGNESADLDSVVSSLCLAHYYSVNDKLCTNLKSNQYSIIPLININRDRFPFKTEVVYFLNKYKIPDKDIIFRDEIDEKYLEESKKILVDHHDSELSNIIEIIDHRPFNKSVKISSNCKVRIEEVGSCATLIGDIILKNNNIIDEYKEILKYLYEPIIMDTFNCSETAKNVKELDMFVLQCIEKLQIHKRSDRDAVYKALCDAKNNIDSLNTYQLLFKDLKILSNKEHKRYIAIPGFPIFVQEYIQKDGSEDAVKQLAIKFNCNVILLMGLKVIDNDQVKRDLGIININNNKLFECIVESLTKSTDPEFCLEEYVNCNFMNGKFFKQNNICATRKQILPICLSALNDGKI